MKKTVLITGASSGFGEAIARRFAEMGFSLVLAARRLERLQQLSESLPVNCFLIQLDVRDRKAVERAIDDLPDEFSTIDILINNAGLALGLGPAHEADLDDWDTMIDTNIKGLTYVTRAVLPGMVARQSGHVVNMGSIAGDWPYPGGNSYGASKAFVKQFSLNLRADLQGKNVRVTNIEPGLAQTEFSVVRFHGDQQKANSIYEGLKPLLPADIAETVIWATSLPEHVNINRIEVMPTCQSFSPLAIAR
ncbi:MAG TPA: SDR family oxidoreductase [Aeromonadales bacterium]|nr:SDR family oxidoreductase [Aeromonadales bacterium]